jgi:hypothetical protein
MGTHEFSPLYCKPKKLENLITTNRPVGDPDIIVNKKVP